MAKSKEKNSAKELIPGVSTRRRRAVVFLCGLILLTIAAAVLGILLKKWAFTANPRLALRNVRLSSSGYWETPGREKELCRLLELKMGTNLFDIDPGKLTAQLESIPCVRSGTVQRILPDTLLLELVERTPRAVLFHQQSPWVIDEDGVVMEKQRSEAAKLEKLPLLVIQNPKIHWQGGEVMSEAQPALDLLMTVISTFPNIAVQLIDSRNPDHLRFWMTFLNQPTQYCVKIPRDSRKYPQLLHILQSAVVNAKNVGDHRKNYDLSFNGQVIIH